MARVFGWLGGIELYCWLRIDHVQPCVTPEELYLNITRYGEIVCLWPAGDWGLEGGGGDSEVGYWWVYIHC